MDVREWLRRKTPYDVRVLAGLASRQVRGRAARLPRLAPGQRPSITWSEGEVFLRDLSAEEFRQLQHAAEDLDGRELAPGAVFSFWANVRRPAAMARYRSRHRRHGIETPIDEMDALSLLASLVYEAGLSGGLDVVERHAHVHRPMPGRFGEFETGMDAAVEYGLRDLQLRNSTGTAIAFDIHVEPWGAHCALRAAQHIPFDVTYEVHERVIHPPSLFVSDPGLRPGEERVTSPGAPGAHVELTRVITRSNGEQLRDELPGSDYEPVQTIIGRGALAREAAPRAKT